MYIYAKSFIAQQSLAVIKYCTCAYSSPVYTLVSNDYESFSIFLLGPADHQGGLPTDELMFSLVSPTLPLAKGPSPFITSGIDNPWVREGGREGEK